MSVTATLAEELRFQIFLPAKVIAVPGAKRNKAERSERPVCSRILGIIKRIGPTRTMNHELKAFRKTHPPPIVQTRTQQCQPGQRTSLKTAQS